MTAPRLVTAAGGRLRPLWEILDNLPPLPEPIARPQTRFGGHKGNRKSPTRLAIEAMAPGDHLRIESMTPAQLSSTWWWIRREFPDRKYSARWNDGGSSVWRLS